MTSPSPMMAQWHECKEKAKEALLLFRLGDFYEAFYEDALIISKEIELTLTKRQDVPMCGVPFHACELYIDKLLAKGHKIALAEQMEDPKQVKGLVKREIVRIITPGTVISSSLLKEKSNNYLAALSQVNASFGLALLDLTTAEFKVLEIEEKKELLDELARLRPSEIVLSGKLAKRETKFLEELRLLISTHFTHCEEWRFDPECALKTLLSHFRVQTLDGFGLKGMAAAINAAGALLSYVKEELQLTLSHVEKISTDQLTDYMSLDRMTQKHLELAEPLHRENKEGSLLSLIDRTATPMGGRKLKQWLLHPLLNPQTIALRQEALLALQPINSSLLERLQKIGDLERVIIRISSGYATPRDLGQLKLFLEEVPGVQQLLAPLQSALIQTEKGRLKDLSWLTKKLEKALVETPPLRINEGGIFQSGYHKELDELRSIVSEGQLWMSRYQSKLREETEIKTLKVSYTKAFGYYIEVSRGQADKMPVSFQRKQTLVNAERFISPELKEYEVKALSAEEKIIALEAHLFHELRREISQQAPLIIDIASALAVIDSLTSLSSIAKEMNWVRPVVDTSSHIFIENGRHPVIEKGLPTGSFIPNDTQLDDQSNRLLLITGPNMAGKSTYMRQVALIVILAQIGSFVPATRAHIGIVDKTFTRIGASDDLSRGQSTFMVEMAETANILHNATPRSLVLLDEIGRGTSTFDGISIAWAVAEHLLTNRDKRAKTLFATHYWELTKLEEQIPGAVNYTVVVDEQESDVIFQHKIKKGRAHKSYGIHVAKLAGLPPSVIKSAAERLSKLEKQQTAQRPCADTEAKKESSQLTFLL